MTTLRKILSLQNRIRPDIAHMKTPKMLLSQQSKCLLDKLHMLTKWMHQLQ
jgi:hypothetical protein